MPTRRDDEFAALMHEHSADLGFGDVEEHRGRAARHRQAAEADRAEADVDERLAERAGGKSPGLST